VRISLARYRGATEDERLPSHTAERPLCFGVATSNTCGRPINPDASNTAEMSSHVEPSRRPITPSASQTSSLVWSNVGGAPLIFAPRRAGENESPRGAYLLAVLLAFGALAVRGLLAVRTPLLPDETYYWDWSRHLAMGYFDHPPMVAMMIFAGTRVLGSTLFGIRVGTLGAGFVAVWFVIALARDLGGARSALRASLMLACIPLAAVGLAIATTDAPVLAATATVLFALQRAIRREATEDPSMRWWLFAGLALGIGLLSKYTTGLLVIGVLIAFVTRGELRALFRRPGPYVASAVAAIMLAPVIYWNLRHGFVSFRFQLGHGLGGGGGGGIRGIIGREVSLLGGQLALVSPVLLALLVVSLLRTLRRERDSTRYLLGVVGVTFVGFFVLSALRKSVEPNWPAAGYLPAVVLLATDAWQRAHQGLFRIALGVGGLLVAVSVLQVLTPVLPLDATRDPVARAYGWANVADATRRVAAEPPAGDTGKTWVAANRYQDAAELAYFMRVSTPQIFSLNIESRPNQYDLWPTFDKQARAGDDLVLVIDDDEGGRPPAPVARLTPFFAGVARGDRAALARGTGVVGYRRVWRFSGWSGKWPQKR
jgi:hypothetical protein